MNTELIKKIENANSTKAIPDIKIGDSVEVKNIIRDKDKKRIQKFAGIVIAIQGKGNSKTFTVRKISYGVGVEKIFPLYSTNIESITINKHAKVRRSKLYFLRDRVGKAAMKLKMGKDVLDSENEVMVSEADVALENEVAPSTDEDATSEVKPNEQPEASTQNQEQSTETKEEKA